MRIDVEQKSDAWLKARLGVCTASRFSDILPGVRGKYKVSRENYLYELAAERLTGISKVFRESIEMAHGNEFESEARDAYEFITGNIVTETGITILDDNLFIGASPDGLVNDIGGIEIKCFDTKRHLKIVVSGMPAELMPQVQGNIWINDCQWWDFVSYDPRITGTKNIYIQRIERDNDYIKTLKDECFSFLNEIDEVIKKVGE